MIASCQVNQILFDHLKHTAAELLCAFVVSCLFKLYFKQILQLKITVTLNIILHIHVRCMVNYYVNKI